MSHGEDRSLLLLLGAQEYGGRLMESGVTGETMNEPTWKK